MSDIYEDATAQGWLAQAFNALTMDTLWTQQLNVAHMTPDEMRRTAEIGESLLDSWQHLTSKSTLKQLSAYCRGNAERASAGARSSESTTVPHDPGDLALMAVRLFHQLEEISASEFGGLAHKIDSLRNAVWTPGDLSPQARCLLLAAATMVALALGQIDVGGFLSGWFGLAGCPKLLLKTAESEA